MKIKCLCSIFCFVLFSLMYSQETKTESDAVRTEVIDRLNIPGPLTFNGNEFFLTRSKQNSVTWVQQQYIQRDDDVDHYKELINISYFDKEIDTNNAVKQKVQYIENRKNQTQDKYSFVNVTESPDGKEIVVDYLVTVITEDGEPYAEYNFDRFKSYDKNGSKSFLIFSYSKRLEGDLKYATKSLLRERSSLMETIIKTAIPPVTYKPTDVAQKKK